MTVLFLSWPTMKRFVFLAGAVVAGCSSASSPYDDTVISPGIRVTVIHPGTSSGGRGSDDGARQFSECVFQWDGPDAGQVTVTVDHLQLSIDGDDCGAVQRGDHVVVDATAGNTVTVNGKTRQRDVKPIDGHHR
jgi:hypothetical protein